LKPKMIIDGHAHVFSPQVIARGAAQKDLVGRLCLEAALAPGRTDLASLRRETSAADVAACLLLPTAPAEQVAKTNDTFIEMAAEADFLYTGGTLHPSFNANREELGRLHSLGIRMIKLCSFSQRFSLAAPETAALFELITEIGHAVAQPFFVILDTFYEAHRYFGTPSQYTTTPSLLADIAGRCPELTIVAAHMGGLAAPPAEIVRFLQPAENLYLDTSVAAHTLAEADFLRLLELHGPDHIIFGTDWPWFGHRRELEFIDRLLSRAGCSNEEKERIFGGNISNLLGIGI